VRCAVKEHRCQAEIWEDEKPLCMRCANDEPCCFETAAQMPRPRRFDEVPEKYLLPAVSVRPQPRQMVTHMPSLEKGERAEIYDQLKIASVEQVARRHGFEPWVIERMIAMRAKYKAAAMRKPSPRKMRVDVQSRAIVAVQEAVAARFGLKREAFLTSSHARCIVIPRHVAMYISIRVIGASMKVTASAFGACTHTTVVHGVKRIESRIREDAALSGVVEAVRDQFSAMHAAA
jgi:hypothetical protein